MTTYTAAFRTSNLLAVLAIANLAGASVHVPQKAATASATGSTPKTSDERKGFDWAAFPALKYSSDEGFGYGVLGSLYWRERGVLPYRYALTIQVFMTTEWIQAHKIYLDAVRVADLPLRLTGEIGYFSTINRNFCGLGNLVTCDPAPASAAATLRGLEGESHDAFVRHYHQYRFIQPYGYLNGRWGLLELPARLEIMAGWRGYYYYSGDLAEQGPYPGSLYSRTFPEGETGLASVLQVGLLLDGRDNEPAPTRGYLVETSLRGSSSWWGSAWEYLGANLTLRGYVPLDRRRLFVLAGRLILDGQWGEPPVQEMVRIGGSHDFTAFGGEWAGRGIRLERFIGKIKAIGQGELRWNFLSVVLADQFFDFTLLGFFDAGHIRYDWDAPRGDPFGLRWSVGGGVRGAWNQNFVVRVDVAASPWERDTPGLYVNLNHVF